MAHTAGQIISSLVWHHGWKVEDAAHVCGVRYPARCMNDAVWRARKTMPMDVTSWWLRRFAVRPSAEIEEAIEMLDDASIGR